MYRPFYETVSMSINFQDYVFSPNVKVELVSLGCECEDCFAENCGQLHNEGTKFYTPKGQLSPKLRGQGRTGIFECNQACGCSKSCFNRVTQVRTLFKNACMKSNE